MNNITLDKEDAKMAMVFSYLALRSLIGILGVAFPFLLVIGASIYSFSGIAIESSISTYYHTSAKHIFGGVLFIISFFLFAYIGYEDNEGSIPHCGRIFSKLPKRILSKLGFKDNTVGNWACLWGICLTLFPTTPHGIVGKLHYAFAAMFFACLIYFCFFSFTRSKPGKMDDDKRKRNRIYRRCGYSMIVFLILIPLGQCSKLFGGYELVHDKINYVFWLETFALWAFGVSWLAKGKVEEGLALSLFRSAK